MRRLAPPRGGLPAAVAFGAIALLSAVSCTTSDGGDEPTPTPPATVTPTIAPLPTPTPARSLDIRTVLPKDAIPAILNPIFVSGAEADAQMVPQDLVIGVSIDGDHRAYSTSQLSSHEVVNDTVGGRPIVVTW